VVTTTAAARIKLSKRSQVRLRLRVPCTPSELAADLEMSVRVVRAYLYEFKREGLAKRLDRRIPKGNPTGRQWEYLWSIT
jgi:transcription initiation factor IIE alpha subunit